jgi:hypothetical protein
MRTKKARATKKVFVPPNLEAVKLIMALKDPLGCYAKELELTGFLITPEMSAAFINFSKTQDPDKVRKVFGRDMSKYEETVYSPKWAERYAQPTKQ